MTRASRIVIGDVAQLEAHLGPPSKFAQMLDIDHIDSHIVALLAHARLSILVVRQDGGSPRMLAAASAQSVCEGLDPGRVRFSRPTDLAPADRLGRGVGVGSLLIIPGLGETVRLNGHVLEDNGAELIVGVDQAIVHCAKAFLRSNFWALAGTREPAVTLSVVDPRDFIRAASLVCIGSTPSSGPGDVSPKGEDGSVAIFDGDDRLIIAERPGNQRHDTFRNIIDQPDVALFFLIRGQDRAAYVRGKMTVMMDENFQSALISGGRPARAVCVIDIKSLEMTASLGLARARFWDPSTWPLAATLPSIGQIMHDHIKLHRDRSAAAEDVRAGLNHEDLDASAQADYRDNL